LGCGRSTATSSAPSWPGPATSRPTYRAPPGPRVTRVVLEGDVAELAGPTLKDLKMTRVEDFLRGSLGIGDRAWGAEEPEPSSTSSGLYER
jgi:hypothetical protein